MHFLISHVLKEARFTVLITVLLKNRYIIIA